MKKKLALIVVFTIFGLLYFSCSDSYDILSPPQKLNVSGKVIGGMPNIGASNVKVKIEDKVMYTDTYGNFNINEIEVPYDVFVSDTLYGKHGSVYKNLTNTYSWLNHYIYELFYFPYKAYIHVDCPGYRKFFFTDGKHINKITDNSELEIMLPENKPVIGKVCALITSYRDNNIYYDKFGYIDSLTILPNSFTNINFTDSMLSYNPSETVVSGYINTSMNNQSLSSSFWISMSPRRGLYYSVEIKIYGFDNNTFNFNIPSNLPVDYYPILNILCYDTTFQNGGMSLNYILPKSRGTNLNIELPLVEQISSPQAYSYVDTNTIFYITGNNNNSQIYQIYISIYDSLKSFYIYTKENNFTLKDYRKFGFGDFIAKSKIRIHLTTYGIYNNIDDYVNPEFPNIGTYSTSATGKIYYIKP